MAYVTGTELNGVLAPGGNIVMTFTVPVAQNSTGNTLTFIIGDSSDSYVDSTAYIANLHATCVGGGGAGMSSLAAEPAAANLAPQAPANGPAQFTPCGAQAAVSGSSDDCRVLLPDTSNSAAPMTSVAVGSVLSPPAQPAGNGENVDTVGLNLIPITAPVAISTSDASTPGPALTTGTNGLTDRGLSAAAVDSLLSNGLDNLGGAQTLGAVATAQIREDAQA